jgi:hypothetical protein
MCISTWSVRCLSLPISGTVSLPSTDKPVGLRHSLCLRLCLGCSIRLSPANHNQPGQAIRGPSFQDSGYHHRILSNPDYCMASRLQWHYREPIPSAEGRPHVPCRWTFGRSFTVGPVGNSHCMEGGLESLISWNSVRFSPALTGGILRPFPRRLHRRHRRRVPAESPQWKASARTSVPACCAHPRSLSRTWPPPRMPFYGMLPIGEPSTPRMSAHARSSTRAIRPIPSRDLYHRGSGRCEDSLHWPPEADVRPAC